MSSRSSHSAADVRAEMDANSADLNTIIGYVDEIETRLTAARALLLDNLVNLDVTVGSRLATAGYTAPDNATLALVQKILRNKTITNPATGLMTVYDDDGATPLFTANLYEDIAAAQLYRGQGAERRERLV